MSDNLENKSSDAPKAERPFKKRRQLHPVLRYGIIAIVGCLFAAGIFYGLRELGY